MSTQLYECCIYTSKLLEKKIFHFAKSNTTRLKVQLVLHQVADHLKQQQINQNSEIRERLGYNVKYERKP